MKSMFLVFSSLFFSCCVFAQQIRYDLAAPNAVHHEAEITLTATGLPAGPAVFRMSRSSPGRYATHEFGKNVYNVRAVDGNNKPLRIEKIDADVYRVSNHKGTINVMYTLYGNYADGTYADIDPAHFHLNMPAVFMWVKGQDKTPIALHLSLPDPSWTIATQLKPTTDPATFTALGLQYFMDSPTKAGKLQVKSWTIANPDKKVYNFRLALEADSPDAATQSLADNVERIVREAQAVFGELPSYDYGTYTFLASINPYVHGDGMEHRNSTMITIPATRVDDPARQGVFAHEFFHCWNVERIRPKSLEPFNFEKSNMSEALWVAEGFTQYYGQLLMKRAGLVSDDDFFQNMAGLINAKENTPGAQNYTPIQNSQLAVFVDAGVSVDRTNYPNMHTSYYPYGGALALALDLTLRQRFNQSMDAFMRELWKRFGKPEKPYTLPGVETALAAVSSVAFASDFFKRYVYGHESIDYNALLQAAGLQLKRVNSGAAWIGNLRLLAPRDGAVVIAGNTVQETPLYKAGLDANDVLVSIGGKEIKSPADVESMLKQQKPGDKLKLVYSHRNQPKETEIVLAENPAFVVVPTEATNTANQTFRQRWFGSHLN